MTNGAGTDPFPLAERVIYRTNPLSSVLCQVRFQPLLRLDTAPPADLQEALRADYPVLREAGQIQLPPDVPNEIRGMLTQFTVGQTQKAYDFVSEDEHWTVGLSRTFIALSTDDYVRWEEFRDRLVSVLDAFTHVYGISSYERVGLRYQNAICPEAIGLGSADWASVIQPVLAGELSNPDFASRIKEARRSTIIEIDPGMVRLQHGIGEVVDADPSNTRGTCYLIDADFFTDERTGANDVESRLNDFHRYSGSLFRWCITQQVHDALGPEPA